MSEIPEKPNEDKAQEPVAELFGVFLQLLKEHQTAVTQVVVVSSALLQAVKEKMPEVYAVYQERLRRVAEESPFIATSRRLAADLERITAKLKQ